MNTVFRAGAVYVVLLLIFRLIGKRSLAQITSFDFVLLIIISETTQQAMVGNDFSLSTAVVAILTLVMADLGLSLVKRRSGRLGRWFDGLPEIMVEKGQPLRERMKMARVEEADILSAARCLHGLERMEQIRYAVLERNGQISIIPEKG